MPPPGPYLSKGLGRPALHDEAVLRAMSRVPRHRFVPDDERDRAYDDRALSIGWGQTISQPFIVALMTQESGVGPGSKVLEIGTGSGYQAAVLAELGARVLSIELVPELAAAAARRLAELGYDQVTVRQGDGWLGWPEEAPFDAILVTASSPELPRALINQLAQRGRLVVPIEVDDEREVLTIVERDGEDLVTRQLASVRFVPLRGKVREPVEPPQGAGEPVSWVLEQLGDSPSGAEKARRAAPESKEAKKDDAEE